MEYDSRNDLVVGFHNHDDLSLQKVANHALLILRKGLKSNWKLPVAHLFSSGVTTKEDLAKIVKTTTLFQVGLRVRAPVCDQGSTNRKASNKNKAKLFGTRTNYPFDL